MTTIAISTELPVVEKFIELMSASIDADTIYARTKETMEKLFSESALNNSDRAAVLADMMAGITSSLTGAAMDASLRWCSTEVELELKKLETQLRLDLMIAEKDQIAANIEKAKYESIATQAEVMRIYGTPTVAGTELLSLADEGKVWWDIEVTKEQKDNLVKEGSLLDSRLNESFASIHKIVADTVVNYGPWTYSLSDSGIATAPIQGNAGILPLSDVQREIAKQQAMGYGYNAWANAVTAAAGMIGTAIASDGAITEITPLVTIARTTMEKLQNVAVPTFA